MNIGAIGQNYQAEYRKIENAKNDKAKAKSNTSDKPAFSQKAVDLASNSASVDSLRAQINLTPDVREEKLSEVREKIRQGHYDDPEVADHLAEALTKSIFIV